jgi:OFA family oxalate/formate antiporter-like MFS transporter
MRRYLVLVASVVMQVCLGGTYAWSVFVPALSGEYGLSSAQTQAIFGVTIALLCVSMVFAGRLQDRWGPRPVAMIGAVLYACGYLLASRSGGRYPLLLLGNGFIVGTGIGFAYVCSLATCIKWFPERKGLITGITVAGYGAGAIVLSSLAAVLFARGLDVLAIFHWVGLGYGSVVFLAALALVVPATGPTGPAAVTVRLGELLRHRALWGAVSGIFCGTCAGVMVIGNLKPIGLDAKASLAVATAAISTLAVGNALGRISWGAVYDRWGRRAIPVSLLFLAGAVRALLAARSSSLGLLVTAVLVGFGYGACLVLYAAWVASVWGPQRVGSVYSVVMLFHGAAALVGPPLGGRLYDLRGDFTLSLLVGAGIATLGAAVVWALQTRDKEVVAEAPVSEGLLMVEPPD